MFHRFGKPSLALAHRGLQIPVPVNRLNATRACAERGQENARDAFIELGPWNGAPAVDEIHIACFDQFIDNLPVAEVMPNADEVLAVKRDAFAPRFDRRGGLLRGSRRARDFIYFAIAFHNSGPCALCAHPLACLLPQSRSQRGLCDEFGAGSRETFDIVGCKNAPGFAVCHHFFQCGYIADDNGFLHAHGFVGLHRRDQFGNAAARARNDEDIYQRVIRRNVGVGNLAGKDRGVFEAAITGFALQVWQVSATADDQHFEVGMSASELFGCLQQEMQSFE